MSKLIDTKNIFLRILGMILGLIQPIMNVTYGFTADWEQISDPMAHTLTFYFWIPLSILLMMLALILSVIKSNSANWVTLRLALVTVLLALTIWQYKAIT
jgi:hypothetical protein